MGLGGWPQAHASPCSAVQVSWRLWGVGLGRNCIPCSNREEKGPIGGTSQRRTDCQSDFTEQR